MKYLITLIKRMLTRNKLFSFINVTGLAISLSAFLLITVWVFHVLSYDGFNVNARQMYRIITDTEGEQSSALSVPGLSGSLKEKYPQVVQSCRIAPYFKNAIVKNSDKVFKESGIIAADTNFFRFFSYKLLIGNPETVLNGPDKIVLTASMAEKYFGSSDPVGNSITLIAGNRSREMEISGIVEDAPINSHIKFDFIASNILGNNKFSTSDPWFNWELLNWYTYIQLSGGVGYKSFESLIRDEIRQNYPASKYRIRLQPLKKIYLFSGNLADANLIGMTGDIRHIKVMSVAAFLILFTACLNFLILQFACSLARTREIGLKKIYGAARSRIAGNLMFELLFHGIIAFLISMIILSFTFPSFTSFIDLNLNVRYPQCWSLFASIGILSVTLLLTGIYPAILLSGFKPFVSLKGVASMKIGSLPVLKVLMAFQLMVSLILLISTMVMNRQLKLIRDFNPGLNTKQVVYFPCDDIPYDYRTGIDLLKTELMKIPGISFVTCGTQPPIAVDNYMDDAEWDGKEVENKTRFHYLKAEHDFLRTFDIKLTDGRDFSNEIVSDDSAFIINEAAAKALNIKSPVGKNMSYIFRGTDTIRGKIIGITRDFHFNTLYNKIEPLVIGIQVGKPAYIFVRSNSKDQEKLISEIDKTMKRIYPDKITDYGLVSELLEQQYRNEFHVGKIFNLICALTLFITMLGLFSHSVFSVQSRSKEIGIRKVNGANIPGIIKMLLMEFFRLFIIAFLIAAPLASYIMSGWLQNFAYKTKFDLFILIEAGLFALFMVLITVIWQSIRLAMQNINDIMRTE